MKKIIAKLNVLGAKLTEESTNEQVVAAIDSIVKPADPKGGEPNTVLVDILMTAGESAGVITAENKDAYTELAKTNVELFAKMFPAKSLVAKAPEEKPEGKAPETKKDDLRISDLIAKLKVAGGTADDSKKLLDHSNEEIDELKEKQPEVYAKLYKEHYGFDYKNLK